MKNLVRSGDSREGLGKTLIEVVTVEGRAVRTLKGPESGAADVLGEQKGERWSLPGASIRAQGPSVGATEVDVRGSWGPWWGELWGAQDSTEHCMGEGDVVLCLEVVAGGTWRVAAQAADGLDFGTGT